MPHSCTLYYNTIVYKLVNELLIWIKHYNSAQTNIEFIDFKITFTTGCLLPYLGTNIELHEDWAIYSVGNYSIWNGDFLPQIHMATWLDNTKTI